MRKFITPIAGAALAILCLSGTAIAANADSHTTFSDVPASHGDYIAIEKAYNEGLVSGRGDGTFDPHGAVTHAELYQVLARAVGADTGEADGHWAGKAILYLENEQNIQVVHAGDPALDQPIRRAEAVSILYRVLDNQGYLTENSEPMPDLTDDDNIPQEFREDIHNAYRAGLSEKLSSSRVSFVPNGYLRRSTMCAMLANSKADFAQNKDAVVMPKTIESGKAGFSEVPATGDGVRSVYRRGRTYYSINDLAAYTGDAVSEAETSTSDFFYHLDKASGDRLHNVEAKTVTVGESVYKIHRKHLERDKTYLCTDEKAAEDAAIVVDGDLYISAKIAQTMTGKTFVTADGELRILTNGEYPAFISKSNMTAEAKEFMFKSLWLLYNASPKEYAVVMDNIKDIELASSAYLKNMTGKEALAGAPYANPGVVVWNKDFLFDTTYEYTAAILAHEATHFQQYRVGDFSETVPEAVGDTVLAAIEAAN